MVTLDTSPISSTQEMDAFFQSRPSRPNSRDDGFASSRRSAIVGRFIELLKENRRAIVELTISETGKSDRLAQNEFDAALRFARLCQASSEHTVGALLRSIDDSKHVQLQFVPSGIALLISAFNTPLPNIFWKLMPSFMAGNRSILCPSPHVSRSAEFVVRCLWEAGASHLEVAVTSGDPALAEYGSRSASVNLISFTGSNRVGKLVSSNSSLNHPRLILEMGGTNPTIVFPASDPSLAARSCLISAFSNGGQRCASGSIALVHEDVFDDFREALLELANDSQFTSLIDEENTPLIDGTALKRHEEFLQKSADLGLEVHSIASSFRSDAIPSIVWGVDEAPSLCSQELFSPILRVVRLKDSQELLEFANGLPLRLTSSVWTEKIEDWMSAIQELDFGLINLNGPTFGAEPNFPFGGMGSSGNGSRDAGFDAVKNYAQTRIWTMRI